MLKKYISNSDIAISVMLGNRKSVHVSFSPLTGGGSVLYTHDAELQEALERHPKYGHLFRLDGAQSFPENKPKKPTPIVIEPPKVSPTIPVAADAGGHDDESQSLESVDGSTDSETVGEADNNVGAEAAPFDDEAEQTEAKSKENNSSLKEIHVDNLDDAKEYLCDHFGLSRTKLRSKKAIIEAAATNGIEFVGI